MCDFKPGDEVVCVNAGEIPVPTRIKSGRRALGPTLVVGAIYRVTDVVECAGEIGLVLAEMRTRHPTGAYLAERFRKVQKRDSSLSIESFLTIKPGQFEEPRRETVKPKREKV